MMNLRAFLILWFAAWLLSAEALASGDDYERLDFESLAALTYDPKPPDETGKTFVRKDADYLRHFVLPRVLALDGKSVEITGYMLPLTLKDNRVEEFMLMPDTGGCCYGMMPACNGYVYARAKKGVKLLDNVPIRIRGKLAIEEVWENGYFSHLYSVEVDEVVEGFGMMPSKPLVGPLN